MPKNHLRLLQIQTLLCVLRDSLMKYILNLINLRILHCLLLYASSSMIVIAGDLDPVITDVFPSGMNGVKLYRIPGVVVTTTGRILAYCEARRNNSGDWGEIEIHLRTSDDAGKTWSTPRRIAHQGIRIEGNPIKKSGGEYEQTVNNPVAIIDRATGDIYFLYCINYARCYSMISKDDGNTWSSPVDITNTFLPFRKSYDWKVIATGPGHGIQLKSGRLVVPIWLAYGKPGDHHPSASATIFSDDHGKTWRAGEIAIPNKEPYVDPNETMITELHDGRVMLVTRSESKSNRKLITLSADGATGWSKSQFHPQLWEPICMASIAIYSTKPGVLLFSNPHMLAIDKNGKEIPGGRGKRQNLSIKMSYDNGKTWPISRTLESGPSAYSDLSVLPDGSIICLYEGDKTIRLAKFTIDWLRNSPRQKPGN